MQKFKGLGDGFAEEVGIVDFGAFVFVEFLRSFATVAASEFEIFATFVGGPIKHGVPEGTADALATDARIGDKIFEVGVFPDNGTHGDGKSGDADDFLVIIESDKHVVVGASDEVFKPFAGDFSAVFATSG